MGVDTAGGFAHGLLSLQSQRTDGGHGFRGVQIPGEKTLLRAVAEIGAQCIGTGEEMADIHILVSAGVVAIHQTGLGGGGDLLV